MGAPEAADARRFPDGPETAQFVVFSGYFYGM